VTEPLLVLQHIACEPPAAYEDELVARGIGLHRVEVDEGESLPDWRGFSGIIAMGGPMGAYEDERLPWLTAEWGDVPAYADSLRALLGEDGLSRLTDAIGEHERQSIALARSLFSRWLEQVVGVPAVASAQSQRVS
jgi:hypothetical protein